MKRANGHSLQSTVPLGTWLVLVILATTSCGFGGTPKVDVELLAVEESFFPPRLMGEDIWFSTYSADDLSRGNLVRIDPDSLTVKQEIMLPPESGGSFVFNDAIYTTKRSILDGVPQTGGIVDQPEGATAWTEGTVFKSDLETGEPVLQYPLYHQKALIYTMFTDNGYFWYTSARALSRINLTTGEHEYAIGEAHTRLFPNYQDNQVLGFSNRYIQIYDMTTGEKLTKMDLDYNADENFAAQSVHYYDRKYWITGSSAYIPLGTTKTTMTTTVETIVFDLDTGEISNPETLRPRPQVQFEQDDIRWECCFEVGDLSFSEPYDRDSKATWTKVDIKTDEVLGQYRFDGYTPTAEHGGYLWLYSDKGIGRVSLAELETP